MKVMFKNFWRNNMEKIMKLLKGPFNIAVVSIVLATLGQYFLYIRKNLLAGLIISIIAIILFWLADRASKIRKESFEEILYYENKEKFDRKLEILLFSLIVIVGIFFRTYLITEIPSGCYRDEGQNGNEALNIIDEIELDGTKLPVYIDRNTQNAAMYIYFIAAFFKLFGIGVLQIRLVSVLLGILTIPAFYFLLRYLFGVRIALIGAFLLAVLRWHVNFSRIGFLGVFTVFMLVLILYFLYRAYKEGRTGDFLLLGFTTAFSLYSYIAARLIPAGLLLFFIYLFFRNAGFFKYNLKKLILSFIVFIVVFAPLGNYIIKNPQVFMRRTATVSIFNKGILEAMGGVYVNKDGKAKHPLELYTKNFINTILMFNYFGDGNPRHNYGRKPMLDFITGIFFILGFGLSLIKFYKPFYFVLFSLFFALFQAGLFSIESPQAYRTIPIIPIVIIFVSISIAKIWEYCREQYKGNLNHIIIGITAALLVYIAYDNYDQYFIKWANDHGAWAEFSTDEWHMGKYVHSLGPDWTAIVVPGWAESYTFEFMTYPYRNYVKFDPSEWIPIKAKIFKNFVYVLDTSYLPLVSVLQKMYPGGRYVDFKHKFQNRILYFAYEVPYEEVKRYQNKEIKNGLTGYYYRDDHTKNLKDVNNHWVTNPLFVRLDPFILFNWTVDPILGPFSVKWVGKIKIEKDGEYLFMTKSNDYSDLFIDNKQILVNPGGAGSLTEARGTVHLKKGFHNIVVRYYESVQYSKMQLWWKPPDSDSIDIIPSEILFPEK
jgi:4-amino-4-deoxy-L-arabinose transferase-like glycosyltransferase